MLRKEVFMNKSKIWIIAAILILIVTGLVIWRVRQESTQHKPKSNAHNELQVNSEELIGLTMKIPGGNRNGYWELNCAKMVNASQYGTLTTINGQFYKANKPVYTLVAQSGFIYWESSILILRGDVKFSVMDGTQLTADEIVWEPKTDMIKAKDRVHLSTSTLEVKTDKIVSKTDLRKVDLKGITEVSFKE
jgi:LPS export ABC transporter protein LptC